MKTTEKIEINGVFYTPKAFEPRENGKNSIFDIYARPSDTKIGIFREWEKKLDYITGLQGNSNTFSIYGVVTDNEGKKRKVWITARNNYIQK